MSQFLADVAFLLMLFVFGGGCVILALSHKVQGMSKSIMRFAGWIMIIGSIVVGILITSFWIRYFSQDAFDKACPMMSMHKGGMGMMMRGMGAGGMGGMGGGNMGGMGPMGPGNGPMGGPMKGNPVIQHQHSH